MLFRCIDFRFIPYRDYKVSHNSQRMMRDIPWIHPYTLTQNIWEHRTIERTPPTFKHALLQLLIAMPSLYISVVFVL